MHSDDTHDVVVLAADGLLGAGAVAANTDDGEGRAAEADRAGDAAIGRKTLAVILPQTSGRWLLLTLIFFWSIGLAQLWHVPAGVVLVNLSLAGACGIRLVIDYSEASDKAAYWWYNVRSLDLTLC